MVDEIDLKIISDLQDDGRKSLTAIGSEIVKKKKNSEGEIEELNGISHVSVKKRINKLIKKQLIKVTADLNVEKFDLQLAMINAEAESHEVTQKILQKFAHCPRVIFLSTIGGGSYNIVCILACEDKETLNSVVKVCSLRNQPGIRRSEVSFCDMPIIPKFLPLKIGINSCKTVNGNNNKVECEKCVRYIDGKCRGCPSSDYYREGLFSIK